MKINAIELFNVLIVIGLIYLSIRKRDVTTLLLVLFVYGTLHFGFATLALATNDSASLLAALHTEGGGLLAKLSTLSLLGVVFALLSKRAYDGFLLSDKGEKQIILYILLAMAALLCGYVFNIRQGDWLQLKNIISLEAMFTLLMIGFLAGMNAPSPNVEKIYTWGLGGLLILGITDCIAIYEVFAQHSWASTLESSGAMVYRASSVLFNPNLLAFWASLVYLACAYGMHVCITHRKMMLWGMVLTSVAIYFSGSRSSGYLLLGGLIISSLHIKDRLRWLPLVILPLTMLTIYLVAVFFAGSSVLSSNGWHEITLLGARFIAAPIYLINYILMQVGVQIGIPPAISFFGIPSEVAVSIEGRFVSEGGDAGWFVLYQDAGWLGTVSMLWISIMSLWVSVRTYYVKRNVASVYAFTTLCCCLLTGLAMRLQIFPVWLFIGVALIPCLIYWARTIAAIHLPVGRDALINN